MRTFQLQIQRPAHALGLTGLVLLGLCIDPPLAVAAEAAAPAAHVEVLQAYKGEAAWPIRGNWRFVVRHACEAGDDTLGFWPGAPVCQGYLVAEYVEPVPKDPYLAYLGRSTPAQTSDDVNVAGKWGTPAQLYDRFAAMDDPVVTIEGLNFKLAGFKERDLEVRRAALDPAQAHVSEQKQEIVKIALGVGLGILVAGAALLFVYRRARRILPRLLLGLRDVLGKGRAKTQTTLDDLKTLHARHVMHDEAIRIATRESFDRSRKERAELRAQIVQALDKGNTELARALTAVLQKLEGDLPSHDDTAAPRVTAEGQV